MILCLPLDELTFFCCKIYLIFHALLRCLRQTRVSAELKECSDMESLEFLDPTIRFDEI